MAKSSLTNFIVSMNRRFRRSQFPFGKSIKLRFYNAAECCLSYFKTVLRSEGVALRICGVWRDVLWVILVHEPARLTNRSPESPALVGGQLINAQPGRNYDVQSLSQG